MENAKDNRKNSSILATIAGVAGGAALGGWAAVANTTAVLKKLLHAVAVFDEEKIREELVHAKVHKEELREMLPAKMVAEIEENYQRLEEGINSERVQLTRGIRNQINEDLSNPQTVLGSAQHRVALDSASDEILKERRAFGLEKRKLRKITQDHINGIVDEAELMEARAAFLPKQDAAIEAEKEFAGLLVKEVPFLERLTTKNLPLLTRQRVESAVIFASVAAVSGYAIHKLVTWLTPTNNEQQR